MAHDVTIRPYQPGDERGILELFNSVFSEVDPLFVPRTLAHWNWQFRDNPLAHHTFVAESGAGAAGHRIVGNYTAIPGVWLYRGGAFTGSQAVDSCVAREHRRVLKKEGLFLTLARRWFDHYGRPERDNIVYGFPNPAAFRVGTRLLDYRPVHTPVTSLNRNFAADWLDWLGPAGADRVTVEEVAEFPPEAADLFLRHQAGHGLVQRRDRAYLDWRYRACPTVRYRLLAARAPDGVLRGVLVFRSRWPGREVAPLVDLLVDPVDREALAGLVRAAARAARADGCACLETWVPPWSREAALFQAVGFAAAPSSFNLCIRVFGPPFDAAWAAAHWYYTMGDSDVV